MNLLDFFSAPAWYQQAACRGLSPSVFHTERGQSTEQAKAVCASCPVREVCLEYALDHHETGIWGQTSTRERARIRRQRKELAA